MGVTKDPVETARSVLAKLAELRPHEIDLAGVARRYKPVGNTHMLREALIWRQEELSRGALEAIERNDGVTGALITRAAMETTAALIYLHGLVKGAIEGGMSDDLAEKLAGFLVGSKIWEENPGPVHVLKMIDAVDKLIPGYRKNYEFLCEFAHPNWFGTLGAYGIINQEQLRVTFLKNGKVQDSSLRVAAPMLAGSLDLFIGYYEFVGDKLKAFAAACEAYYAKKDILPDAESMP